MTPQDLKQSLLHKCNFCRAETRNVFLKPTIETNVTLRDRKRAGHLLRAAAIIILLVWCCGTRSAFAYYAYIASSYENTVSVINTLTDSVIATIPVGKYPFGVAVSPDGSKVYITNMGDNSISVIDTASNTVVANISKVGSQPGGLAVSRDGTKLYVAGGLTNSVLLIDTVTNKAIKNIPVKYLSRGVALSPSGERVYVTNYDNDGIVSIISTAENEVVGSVSVGKYPMGLGISPDNLKVYVANYCAHLCGPSIWGNRYSRISVINTITYEVDDFPANVGYHPWSVAVNTDGNIYVANLGEQSVPLHNGTIITPTNTIEGYFNPQDIDITPDGTKAYVINYYPNTVSVIDTYTNTITGTITVGQWPAAFGRFIGDVKPGVKINLVDAPKDNIYVIDDIPTMPIIKATAQITGVTLPKKFTWTADIIIEKNKLNKKGKIIGTIPISYKEHILQDCSTTGNEEFSLSFEEPDTILGGSLTLKVRTSFAGEELTGESATLIINGTNPKRNKIMDKIDKEAQTYAFNGLNNEDVRDVLKRIACQESKQRQFSASANGGTGPVLIARDNGVGIFQVTDKYNKETFDTPAVLFNWMSNVGKGVVMFKDKTKVAYAYPRKMRLEPDYIQYIKENINPRRKEKGLKGIPIIPAPNFSKTGNIGATPPNQLLEDSVRGYNGYNGLHPYGKIVLHEFVPDEDFLLTVPDNELPGLSKNPNVWRRVPASGRGTMGDQNYVTNVGKKSPLCTK